ncbi:TPA: hypothetical protein HA246_04010 [Candidatus Woesearchaeota archaeon]|nr:hypothetical protein [Candidatus Woesearchaeota archaeon]
MLVKKRLDRSGFIYTLDAIFALVIAATIIIASFQYLSQTHIARFNRSDLGRLSNDALSVLERDSGLSNVVSGSTSNVQSYLNTLPMQMCGNLSVFSVSNTLVGSIQKTGCDSASVDEIVVARRVFVHSNSSTYYARLEAWYR